MDAANENVTGTHAAAGFPLEILGTPRTAGPQKDVPSRFTAKSYDNRSEFSQLSSMLGQKLDGFARALATTFFFSQDFSWLTMTAESSNLDVAVATAYENASEDVWRLQVDTLADSGYRSTLSLVSNDRTDVQTGSYEFSLTVDDLSVQIQVGVENEDTAPLTHHDLFTQMQQALRSSGAAVNATVLKTWEKVYAPEYDGYGLEQFSTLTLAPSRSGQDPSFALEDTSGEIIRLLGLNRFQSMPANSEYSVDSEPFEFYENTVEIDGPLVQAMLTGESDARGSAVPTHIKTSAGFAAAAESVETVITAYNDLIEWIDDNGYFVSRALKTALFDKLNSAALQSQTASHDTLQDDKTPPRVFSVNGKAVDPDKAKAEDRFFPRLNENKTDTLASSLSAIGLTLESGGRLHMESDFKSNFQSRFKKIYQTLSGDTGFFTRIRTALDDIRSRDNDRYVYTLNHVLVYKKDPAAQARKIYQQNLATLINTFV